MTLAEAASRAWPEIGPLYDRWRNFQPPGGGFVGLNPSGSYNRKEHFPQWRRMTARLKVLIEPLKQWEEQEGDLERQLHGLGIDPGHSRQILEFNEENY